VIRIIGGEAKGRKLKSPPGEKTRPTLGRIRQAFFDILQDKVPDSIFLDLFAGTGAVALEALSRGASRAILVEKRKNMIKIIKENLEILGYATRAEVIQGDVMKLGPRLSSFGPFSILFADPPYTFHRYQELIDIYLPLLAPGGTLAIQHLAPFSLALPSGFSLKEKRIGEHLLTLVTGEE